MRIHRFYPSPKSFVPRNPLKSLKIVTMNINNYECLLLVRNELSGWTLYHQNNLLEWAFIPIVLMRNWGLVVLIRCLRSHGNNSSQSWPKPDSAVRVFHRVYANVLLASLQPSAASSCLTQWPKLLGSWPLVWCHLIGGSSLSLASYLAFADFPSSLSTVCTKALSHYK